MSDARPRRMLHPVAARHSFQDPLEALGDKAVLDKKIRELLLTALACAVQCPHCTERHVREALNAGASREEVAEALMIAALEGAGTHAAWYEDIYKEYLGDG